MENSKKAIIHTYHIGGLGCGGCVTTVQHKLAAVPDVTSVKVDLGKKQAEITSSHLLKLITLQQALDNTNYIIAELK